MRYAYCGNQQISLYGFREAIEMFAVDRQLYEVRILRSSAPAVTPGLARILVRAGTHTGEGWHVLW